MTIQERETAIKEFVESCFDNYTHTLNWDIWINDDTDPDATAFEVKITNTYNAKKLNVVLTSFL